MASSLNGTGITFSNATTLSSAPVTSIATGNGLSGGTITTTGTLVIAAPGFNTVGAYVFAQVSGVPITLASGSTYSAGGTSGTVQSFAMTQSACAGGIFAYGATNNLSGSWRYMGGPASGLDRPVGIFCRVA